MTSKNSDNVNLSDLKVKIDYSDISISINDIYLLIIFINYQKKKFAKFSVLTRKTLKKSKTNSYTNSLPNRDTEMFSSLVSVSEGEDQHDTIKTSRLTILVS